MDFEKESSENTSAEKHEVHRGSFKNLSLFFVRLSVCAIILTAIMFVKFNNQCRFDSFKSWYADKVCEEKYNPEEIKKTALNLQAADDKLISSLAERIYFFRCAIAHAKGDADMYMAIPEISDTIICGELPLLKKLSFKALQVWGR